VTGMPQEGLARRVLLAAPTANPPERPTKDQVVLLHLRPGLAPPWCRASRTIRGCWKPWSISSPSRAGARRPLRGGKAECNESKCSFLNVVQIISKRTDIHHTKGLYADRNGKLL